MYSINDYGTYLKRKYGEKVYKLPVSLPVSCPNRDGTAGRGGCTFCAAGGAGFETIDSAVPVKEQLAINREYMGREYKARKFIAFLQNYTNTYMPLPDFESVLADCTAPDIVEISVSTRPDCAGAEYLEACARVRDRYGVNITFELGLQSSNPATLRRINRGHTLSDYIDAVLRIKSYGFGVGTHLILNLPYDEEADVKESAQLLSVLHTDTVKLHNLFLIQGTVMADEYLRGEWDICSYEEYFERAALFVRHLSPDVAIERFFARCPEPGCVFSNWGMSWRRLHNWLIEYFDSNDVVQGSLCRCGGL